MGKTIFGAVFVLVLFAAPNESKALVNSINGLSAFAQFLSTTTGTTTMHMKVVGSGGNTHTFQWDNTPWRANQGGTGATSFSSGGIFYFLNNVFSQSSNLFWDAINNRLGIGNNSPQHALDISGAFYSRLATASSTTINWNIGNVQTKTLTSNQTLTFSNGQAGGEYKLIVKQDGTGGRTITWPESVLWPGGVSPTLTSSANGTDVMSFVYDGTNYLGNFSLNYSTPSGPVVTFNSYGFSQATPSTLTYNVPAMTDGVTVCYVENTDNSNTFSGTTATFGSTSMTQLNTGAVGAANNQAATYYAVGVPSGNQTLNLSISTPGVFGECWFLNGADQTTPINAHAYNNSNSASITTSESTFIIGWLFDGSVSASSPLTHQRGIHLYDGVDSGGMVASGPFTNTWTATASGAFLVAVQAQD